MGVEEEEEEGEGVEEEGVSEIEEAWSHSSGAPATTSSAPHFPSRPAIIPNSVMHHPGPQQGQCARQNIYVYRE
jgi:hypothetical protein